MVHFNEIEKALFDTARSLSGPAVLRAFLDQACQGNPALRSRLEDLLAVQGAAEKFFDGSLELELGDVDARNAAATELPGKINATPPESAGSDAARLRARPGNE